MREAQIPSYRVRETADDGASRRLLLLAGGLAGLVAFGGLVTWGVTRMGDRTIPVVQADARPVKIRPDDRGGLRVANQDEIIFERRIPGRAFDASGRLAPAAEAPNLDALRAATAPPPAGVAPPAVAPMAEMPAAPPPASGAAAVGAVQATPPVSLNGAPAAPAPASVARSLQPPAAPLAPAPVAVVTPAPVVVAAPAPGASRAAGGNVTVQLGALASEASARSEWDRLSRRAPEALGSRRPQVTRFEREGLPTMWRLRTSAESRDSATSLCESVRNAGGACAVIGG